MSNWTKPYPQRVEVTQRLDPSMTDLDIAKLTRDMIMEIAGMVNSQGSQLVHGTITLSASIDNIFDISWRALWEPNE